MKKIILALILLALSHNLFPTAQIPDIIIYDGTKYDLHVNPLEIFFENNPEKRPENGIMSTALWRGYRAIFEVEDNQLYLKDIEIKVTDYDSPTIIEGEEDTPRYFDTKWVSVLDEVFPDQTKITVDWYTGLLVIPHGELVEYIHMGYASMYSEYILLEITDGNLTNEKKMNYKEYDEFKIGKFQEFKKTNKYKELRDELKKEEDNSDEFIDEFLYLFLMDYVSKISE